MFNFIADYAAICHTFNISDVATRMNIEHFIVPRLRQFRTDLTMALWHDRHSTRPVAAHDRKQMLQEVRRYAASIRTALKRIRTYESTINA